MSKTYVAECHCGQVRITCVGEPYPVFMCNCQLCQRRTGSPIHIGAWWPMDDVTMEGATKAFTRTTGEQGMEATFNFCPECGTNIYACTVGEGTGFFGLRLGTINQRAELTPKLRVWCRSALPWSDDLSGLPTFPAQPDLDALDEIVHQR